MTAPWALPTVSVETLQEPEAPPAHPAWLRALWHYDPHYAYDLVNHEYDEWWTTDPYYIEKDVHVGASVDHSAFLHRTMANLEAFFQLGGQCWLWTREVVIRDLPPATDDVPGLDRSRHRIEPDLALWPPDTQVQGRGTLSCQADGPPVWVLECLSPSTAAKDIQDNPAIYDLMGVTEYWICDEAGRTLTGYQHNAAGVWAPVGRPTDTAYSRVLQTYVRAHPDYGFQCRHPTTGEWLVGGDGYLHTGRQEGRTEGLEEGLATGRQEGRTEGLEEGLATGVLQSCQALARWLWGEDFVADLLAWTQEEAPTQSLSVEALTALAERQLTPRDVREAGFQWDDNEAESSRVQGGFTE